MQNWLSKLPSDTAVREFLLVKLQLFAGMLLATITAGLAIMLAFNLVDSNVGFFESCGFFLAFRVVLFMANPSMPLNDKNVAFMSSERTLWNLASIAITGFLLLAQKIL